ncbi:MAG: flagellar motor switch protein FliN [Gemmatimonadales bacterium]|nr:MAG: flagellar motor switch protein FliN [Gemmatimonadales bacterium]
MNNDDNDAIMAAGGQETPASFEELPDPVRGAQAPAEPPAGGGLSLLYDLPLPVSVELGRARLPVQEILGLGRGSVIQLDRLAGEPVDLFVGDRKFAQGEVVVMGEQFAIRITRILASGTALAGATH